MSGTSCLQSEAPRIRYSPRLRVHIARIRSVRTVHPGDCERAPTECAYRSSGRGHSAEPSHATAERLAHTRADEQPLTLSGLGTGSSFPQEVVRTLPWARRRLTFLQARAPRDRAERSQAWSSPARRSRPRHRARTTRLCARPRREREGSGGPDRYRPKLARGQRVGSPRPWSASSPTRWGPCTTPSSSPAPGSACVASGLAEAEEGDARLSAGSTR